MGSEKVVPRVLLPKFLVESGCRIFQIILGKSSDDSLLLEDSFSPQNSKLLIIQGGGLCHLGAHFESLIVLRQPPNPPKSFKEENMPPVLISGMELENHCKTSSFGVVSPESWASGRYS